MDAVQHSVVPQTMPPLLPVHCSVSAAAPIASNLATTMHNSTTKTAIDRSIGFVHYDWRRQRPQRPPVDVQLNFVEQYIEPVAEQAMHSYFAVDFVEEIVLLAAEHLLVNRVMVMIDSFAVLGLTYQAIIMATLLDWLANGCHRSAPDSCHHRNIGILQCSAAFCQTSCTCYAFVVLKHVPLLLNPFE